jgi:SOS response regulatory protein OraA/RecX
MTEETMEQWKNLALALLEQNKRFSEELQEWMKLTERLSKENTELMMQLDPTYTPVTKQETMQ